MTMVLLYSVQVSVVLDGRSNANKTAMTSAVIAMHSVVELQVACRVVHIITLFTASTAHTHTHASMHMHICKCQVTHRLVVCRELLFHLLIRRAWNVLQCSMHVCVSMCQQNLQGLTYAHYTTCINAVRNISFVLCYTAVTQTRQTS